MPKPKSAPKVVEPEISESESSATESSDSEEVVVKKPTKKVPAKKPSRKPAQKKTQAPPAEKKVVKKKVEEPKEEEAPTEEKKPKREKKVPALKPGQRSFRIDLDSISPAVDASKLKKGEDLVQGRSPLQAAKKAFTRILRKYSDTGFLAYSFVIVEDTPESKKASFPYEGKKVKRSEPREIKKGDSVYTIQFDHVVKAVKKSKDE